MRYTQWAENEPRDVCDDGYILMFVLLLLTFLSLVSVPMLNAIFPNVKTTAVVQAANVGFYSSDGGVEYAIQALRADVTLDASCVSQTNAGSSVPIVIPSNVVAGLAITVSATCISSGSCPALPLPCSSILQAIITASEVGGVNEKKVTTNAVVAINTVPASGNAASVESWSSVQS